MVPRANVAIVFLVFFLLGGWPAPEVNEAHYLGRAKHTWNTNWCPRDFFLNSAEAHQVFFAAIGWLTCWFELPAVAWIGRVATWLSIAWSWHRLHRSLLGTTNWSPLTATLWVCGLSWCHISGEWIIGGVEAKGFAFAAVIGGLADAVSGKWWRAWILFGLGTAIHPLVGGWSAIVCGPAWLWYMRRLWFRGREDRIDPIHGLAPLLGLCIALPGIVPAWRLQSGASAAQIDWANQVYVYCRLPHHLLPSRFPVDQFRWAALLLAAWIILSWLLRRHRHFQCLQVATWTALGVALVGFLIFLATRHDPSTCATWMRYYWFRAVDLFLPMGVALSAVAMGLGTGGPTKSLSAGDSAAGGGPAPFGHFANAWLMLLIGLAIAGTSARLWSHQADWRPAADAQGLYRQATPDQSREHYAHWLDVCHWCALNTPSTALFLTPRYQQTFKWYAGRSEVVTWKDVPQDAPALVEWYRRIHDTHSRMTPHGNGLEIARRYGAEYWLADHTVETKVSAAVPLYRVGQFAVYTVSQTN